MKQSRLIFICIFVLLAMLGLLFFSGAIYDAERKSSIDTFFFEPNSYSAQRVLPPISADDIPDKNLREWLVTRFVHEYFYVIPFGQNARERTEYRSSTTNKLAPLFGMSISHPQVFEKWVQDVAPQLIDMADKKYFQTVQVLPDITEDVSGHLIVKYILRTWDKPNDVLAKPKLQTGVLYINVTDDPINVRQSERALDDLQNGEDPVSAFNFQIIDVEQP